MAWSEEDCTFMRAALEEADKSRRRREVPVGCVLVRDGAIIARGHNMTNASRNGTRHAEFEAIDYVFQQSQGSVAAAQFPRCKLYVTVEPCIMCSGALSILGIGEVIFGCGNDKFGGCGSILDINVQGCGGCGGPVELPGSLSEDQQSLEEAQQHQHHHQHHGLVGQPGPPSQQGPQQQWDPRHSQVPQHSPPQPQQSQHHSQSSIPSHHDLQQGHGPAQPEQSQQHHNQSSIPDHHDLQQGQRQQHGPTQPDLSQYSHSGIPSHNNQQQGQGQESGPHCSSTRSMYPGYKHRRGLFADQAVRFLQDFYVCGNPAAPKPHRPLRKPKWELEGQGA